MKLLEPFKIELSGINLIEASAGTGKTYNITTLYIRALIEKQWPVSKILVVTYTEAATKELKERILDRIRAAYKTLKTGIPVGNEQDFQRKLLAQVAHPETACERLQQAMRNFDDAAIYTIHGFCYQALQEQAMASGTSYDAEMIGDDTELIQDAVDDYWRKWVERGSKDNRKRLLFNLILKDFKNPGKLAKQMGFYVGKPYLHTLPDEVPSLNAFLSRAEELIDLLAEMRQLWQTDREELMELLMFEGLNGNKYSKNSLVSWFDRMDRFLKVDFPLPDSFDKYNKFKQTELSESLNKGYEQPPQHRFFELADQYLSVCERTKAFKTRFKKELLSFLRSELHQKKEKQQVLAYDDLLLRLRNALYDSDQCEYLVAALRKKYPLAMVDEFQDTDPMQYEIFRSVYKDSEAVLFMIGDPKQSIYSFRGADVYSYIEAREDAPLKNRYQLDRNYRSASNLLQGLNILWGEHDNPFLLGTDIQYQNVSVGQEEQKHGKLKIDGDVRPPIQFRRLWGSGGDNPNKEDARRMAADDTARKIHRLLSKSEEGKAKAGGELLEAKDIAVLVRTHKQANLISDALRELEIRSVRQSDKSVFKSREAQHLRYLLEAVADPVSEHKIKAALALPLTPFSAVDMLAAGEDVDEWERILQIFSEAHKRWQKQSFMAMYQYLLHQLEIDQYVITLVEGGRRLTNMLHLGELLNRETLRRGLGVQALLYWLAEKREETEDGKKTAEEEQLRLESDQALVKIVTMHKSKGLQYPVVFCPFLWDGPYISDKGQSLVFHHPDDHSEAFLDLNGKIDPERIRKRFLSERETLAEELRLAYVSMTRAEYGLYLSWGFTSDSEFSPLGYLLQKGERVQKMLEEKIAKERETECTSSELNQTMEQICSRNPELFDIAKSGRVAAEKQLTLRGLDVVPSLQAQHFKREEALSTAYRISSFSSISSLMSADPDQPDYDQYTTHTFDRPDDMGTEEGDSIFSFPKGPKPGTCIHNIFEELNFGNPEMADALILEKLHQTGIASKWKNTVKKMVRSVIKNHC